ncbi:MAG: hypothetical protein ACRCT8_18300 [Lacipirellulaceae bacterium]
MKNLLVVLTFAVVTTSVTGCGCFRRARDFVCRGAYCGGSSVAAAPPVMMASPAPVMAYDPSCAYGDVQTMGYPMEADCAAAGYSMPTTYDGGTMIDGGSTVVPGPAPL